MSLNNNNGLNRPRRRIIQNGRLVNNNGSADSSQPRRSKRRWRTTVLLLLLLLTGFLVLTNPANAPYSILSRQYYNIPFKKKKLQSFFGLFAYQQTFFSLKIYVAGMNLDCRWDHPTTTTTSTYYQSQYDYYSGWKNDVCIWLSDTLDTIPNNFDSIWRQLPRKDNALFYYQVLIAILALVNIPPWLLGGGGGVQEPWWWFSRLIDNDSNTGGTAADGGFFFLSPLLTGIHSVFTVAESPTLFSLLRTYMEAKRIVSPALVRIQELVANQDESSFFHVFTNTDRRNNNAYYNLLWTLSCLVLLAATTDRLSVYLTQQQPQPHSPRAQQHPLRFEALLAVCLGVLRTSGNSFFNNTTTFYQTDADPTLVYFAILVLFRVLLQQKQNRRRQHDDYYTSSFDLGIFLIQVLAWMGGNAAGAYLGQYLVEHSAVSAAAKHLLTVLDQWIFTPIDQFLHGLGNL